MIEFSRIQISFASVTTSKLLSISYSKERDSIIEKTVVVISTSIENC